MNKFIPFLVAVSLAFALNSCADKPVLKTNFTPPSVVPITQSVTKAQERTTSIGKHAEKSSKAITDAAVGAKTAQDRIVLLLQATKEQPTIQEMVRLVGNDLTAITLNLSTAKDEIAQLRIDVQDLQSTLNGAQGQIITLKGEAGAQTVLLNKANANANAAIAQSAIDKANAHKFKAIIIGIAVFGVAAALFGIFRFTLFVPPMLWVLLGLPTVVGIVLFFWLG